MKSMALTKFFTCYDFFNSKQSCVYSDLNLPPSGKKEKANPSGLHRVNVTPHNQNLTIVE